MAYDLLLKSGTVIDGSGTPATRADVGIAGGKIREIGALSGATGRTIDASGLVVAPGFIDPHTHYDAQITWDPLTSCSSWHGVTTVVMGNCGFTLAPCRAADRETLMRMLTYVEGMPLEALTRGIRWGWETFGEYLDAVDRIGPWANVACFIGHSAIRQYAMGEAAWEREARADEIARMGELVTDAMRRGAVGLSSTTNKNHVGDRGRPVPSRLAHDDELTSLARTMGASGRGILELTIGGTRPSRVAEVDRFAELARAADRPVTLVSLRHNPSRPEEHRAILARIEALAREGVAIYPQVTTSPLTATFDLTSAFVFFRFPVWKRVLDAPVGDWRAIFRDPGFRDEFRASVGRTTLFRGDTAPVRVQAVGAERFRHVVGLPLSAVAAGRGQDVVDAFFDLALDDDLQTQFTVATMNTDAASVAEIFTHERALIGLSDAGAHLTLFCEAGQTSRLLGRWVRERGAISLEEAVRRITSMPADLFGLADRGRLTVGLAADVTVFDPRTIADDPPELLHDLPGGGPRLVQRARGVEWSFVNGRPVIESGRMPEIAAGGRGPGRVLRAS
ncbi:MAG TPA: amidohydrolase family protein [Methylomirabilota bacterium]